jgi:hypothetical protein
MSKDPLYPHVTPSQMGDVHGDSSFYPGSVIKRGSNPAMLKLTQRLRDTGAKVAACEGEFQSLAWDFEGTGEVEVLRFCRLVAADARENAKTMKAMADILQKKYGGG